MHMLASELHSKCSSGHNYDDTVHTEHCHSVNTQQCDLIREEGKQVYNNRLKILLMFFVTD